MELLPIYRVTSAAADTGALIDHAERVFDITDGFKLGDLGGRLVLERGEHVVEVETASGGVWAADRASLFNPSARPQLPDAESSTDLALRLLRGRGLLPELAGDFAFGTPTVAGTMLAVSEAGRPREVHRLDVQVVVPVLVGDLPVVGGGGDFTLVLGDSGQPIGYHGVWRPVTGAFDAKVVPQESSEAAYVELMKASKTLTLEDVTSYLAYVSLPASEPQLFLYPVYVHAGHATVRGADQPVPLRAVMLPATDFGPQHEFPAPQRPRPKRARPPVSKPKEDKLPRRGYRTLADFAPTALATKPWEAGTSWIGQSGGLAGSKKNAQGFIDEWTADGWIIDFNWGDANAWESDWRRNDDTWVDNADFVFYTGHASMDGWVLSKPDDTQLNFSEVGGSPGAPGDLWGQNDLEWVVVAACGPLQDELLANGGGDVLTRWDGAFDGLHQLLGYGAVTFDNEVEGRKLASYARSGMTIKDAWFRTAKEVQPATNNEKAPDGPIVWVGVMWVGKNGVDPINDHAWSHGSVSADPTSPTFLACMWTVC
jgi:hypothetical protein